MEVIAYQKFIRTTPKKLRLVADAVRDMHPSKALINLQFMHKDAARVLYKVMKQAVSNALNNSKLNEKELVTRHILVEEGPRYKRFMPISRGRAHTILKRTSHVKIVLSTKESKKSLEEK